MRNAVRWLADRSWSVSGAFYLAGMVFLGLSLVTSVSRGLVWCASGAMGMGALVWVAFGRSRGQPFSPVSALVLLALAVVVAPLFRASFGLSSSHPGFAGALVIAIYLVLWANHEWRKRRGKSMPAPEEVPPPRVGDQRPLSRVERNGLTALVAALVALGWWLSGGEFHQPSLADLPASVGVAVFVLVALRVYRYAMPEGARYADPDHLERWQRMTPAERRGEWAWAVGIALGAWGLLESMVGHQVWGAAAITYVLAEALLPVRIFVGWGLAGPPNSGSESAAVSQER